MTPEQLKASILQRAMEGKLVEQRAEEGTGQGLLESALKEKSRLLKDGRIPKEKKFPDITEDDLKFEIPDSWEWVRVGDIFSHNTGKALNAKNTNGTLLSYITTSNLYWDGFRLENLKSMYFTDDEIEKCTAAKGDLLVCEGGDIGRSCVWNYDENIRIQNHIHRLRPYVQLSVCFFYYLFYLYKIAGWIGGKGIGIQGLSANALHALIFPLPPVQEQKRIVAKIEELMPQVDRYAEAYSKLETFNTKFPNDMQKSILQYAMQGKLVEQRSEEGSAEELIEQIAAEKQKLIKEGKIKKEKPYSNSPKYADFPYDIPDSWKYVRFGDLLISRDSERIPVSTAEREKRAKTYDYYGASGIIDKIDDFLFDEELLLIGEDGANLLARSTPIAFIADGKYWVNNHAHVLQMPNGINIKYICYYINSISLAPYVTGTAQPKMNQENMNAIWVPVPPEAEQNRIVEAIEKILPYCNSLKK